MKNLSTTMRSLQRIAAIALLVLVTGCLTIEENYAFKKDGSGTMEYVIDMSAFAEIMKSLENMGDGKDKGKQDMTQLDMKDEAAALQSVPGIKKVKVKSEKDGFIQRLSFSFADLAALNGALNVLMPDSTGVQQQFFHWEGNTLVRTNNRHAAELGGDMAAEDNDSLNMAGMLQSMQYKYSFAFAKEVGSSDVVEGMVKESPSAKEVKFSTDWSVIMKDPKALDLRITLNN